MSRSHTGRHAFVPQGPGPDHSKVRAERVEQFGFAEALQNRLQGVALPWNSGATIPVQFIQMVPYLVTLVVLAGFVVRARAPRALGTLL